MENNSPSIHIQNATLRFSEQTIFDQLNCTIPGGKWTCILGPSGVGKSSLLRLIAELTWEGKNTYLKGNVHASDGLPLKGRIAYMAQHDLLMPWCSVLDNVLIGFKLRGNLTDQREKALSLFADVGLGDISTQYPNQLSGGMRQRVALVRTLLEDRPIVLMDEPFASVDVITRFRLQELAAKLLSGKTVLFVTHDPMEALRLGHHVHVLSGSPAQLSDDLALRGDPPRDLKHPDLLLRQEELLEKLI